MKILRRIIYIILGLVVLVLVVALFLPSKVQITATADINLPVNKVYFSLVNFSDHKSWNPWIQKDSTVVSSLHLEDNHIGTRYSWTSKNSGSGEMIIDSVSQNSYISMKLGFAGMSQKAKVWYELTPKDDRTTVTWGFLQDASYPVGRIFLAFFKASLQKDYNRGIDNLKRLLEIRGVKMSSLSEISLEDVPGFLAMVVTGHGNMEEMSTELAKIYGQVAKTIQDQGLEVAGAPFSHYLNYDEATGMSDYEAGLPVARPGKNADNVKAVKYEGFKAMKATHTGPYDEFMESYNHMLGYISNKNIMIRGEAWEFYLTDPMQQPDESKWRTVIEFPVR